MLNKEKSALGVKKLKGFTFVEILLVVLVIAILAIVVFVSINPSKRLSDSRDARRSTDVDLILSAVHSSIVDNKGALPTGLSNNMPAQLQIGTASGTAISNTYCTVALNAHVDLTTPLSKYLKTIPADPLGGTSGSTAYAIQVDANGIVTVTACNSENREISVSKSSS
jgi:prepilin-type N-terminal cleavage/methylation domain-containing protein